jgi:hypothetical protein
MLQDPKRLLLPILLGIEEQRIDNGYWFTVIFDFESLTNPGMQLQISLLIRPHFYVFFELSQTCKRCSEAKGQGTYVSR